MARPREFDEQAAIAAATDRFWRFGYEATSIRDLSSAMGITGASLYNAFKSKRKLFSIALKQYKDQTVADRMARFESSLPPKQAIRAFFREIITRSCEDKSRKGCFLVNSALEVAPHDPAFGRIVEGILEDERRRTAENALGPFCGKPQHGFHLPP